jgi:hypothetical protein
MKSLSLPSSLFIIGIYFSIVPLHAQANLDARTNFLLRVQERKAIWSECGSNPANERIRGNHTYWGYYQNAEKFYYRCVKQVKEDLYNKIKSQENSPLEVKPRAVEKVYSVPRDIQSSAPLKVKPRASEKVYSVPQGGQKSGGCIPSGSEQTICF